MLNFTNPCARPKLAGLQCFICQGFYKLSDNEQPAYIIEQLDLYESSFHQKR